MRAERKGWTGREGRKGASKVERRDERVGRSRRRRMKERSLSARSTQKRKGGQHGEVHYRTVHELPLALRQRRQSQPRCSLRRKKKERKTESRSHTLRRLSQSVRILSYVCCLSSSGWHRFRKLQSELAGWASPPPSARSSLHLSLTISRVLHHASSLLSHGSPSLPPGNRPRAQHPAPCFPRPYRALPRRPELRVCQGTRSRSVPLPPALFPCPSDEEDYPRSNRPDEPKLVRRTLTAAFGTSRSVRCGLFSEEQAHGRPGRHQEGALFIPSSPLGSLCSSDAVETNSSDAHRLLRSFRKRS